jgi:hypothetical protein
MDEQNSSAPDTSELKDLVLELNFVPRWARAAPAQGKFADAPETRESRERDSRRDRRDARPGPPRRDRPPRSDRDDRDRDRRGPPRGDRAPRPEPPLRLPLRVSLVPEQRQVSALLHQLHVARKAYPVVNLASLLCAKSEFCCAKFEVERDAAGLELYQCKSCRAIALDRNTIAFHVARCHLEDYFDKEEKQVDPPTGQFPCVAKCGLSGTLLGPPNHHSYAERLQEVHRTRFPEMPLDAYRAKVQMCHEPELIEQWKQEACKVTVYRLKNAANEEDSKPLTWTAAESLFQRRFAQGLVIRGPRAVLPVSAGLRLEDNRLARLAREAWERESRFPRNMLFALRAVFRHKRLNVFKVGEGWDYVCSVRPSPLDPNRAVPAIKEVLTHLRDHPGCKRKEQT